VTRDADRTENQGGSRKRRNIGTRQINRNGLEKGNRLLDPVFENRWGGKHGGGGREVKGVNTWVDACPSAVPETTIQGEGGRDGGEGIFLGAAGVTILSGEWRHFDVPNMKQVRYPGQRVVFWKPPEGAALKGKLHVGAAGEILVRKTPPCVFDKGRNHGTGEK